MSLITSISIYLGIHQDVVTLIAKKAPTLYRRYLVPKKKGGMREIFHPAKETKALQLAAIDLLYRSELQHHAVRGYVRGLKAPLLQNAIPHSQHMFLLKLDFSDFFPSIKPIDFEILCCSHLNLNGLPLASDDIDLLKKILFIFVPSRGSFLAIGAPSSPFVSNWIMYQLDQQFYNVCADESCVYTRYADDLCISSNSIDSLLKVEKLIKEIVDSTKHPQLMFNNKKRRIATTWSRRCITGLVLTPCGEIKIPRSTKRFVRTLIHRYKIGSLSVIEKRRLTGFLGYINDCEPSYIHNLVMKYGAETIEKARKRV